jgi:hypothetical protein
MFFVDLETLAPLGDGMMVLKVNCVQIYMLKREFQQQNSYR